MLKVFGISPCEKMASMPTSVLSSTMIKYFKASDNKQDIYQDHLMILVSIVHVNLHYNFFIHV